MSPALLLLHGNNLDETLWLSGAILIYLLFLFISSQIKTRRRKKEKLRRKAERAAQRALSETETNPPVSE
jgi:hypothetical protein